MYVITANTNERAYGVFIIQTHRKTARLFQQPLLQADYIVSHIDNSNKCNAMCIKTMDHFYVRICGQVESTLCTSHIDGENGVFERGTEREREKDGQTHLVCNVSQLQCKRLNLNINISGMNVRVKCDKQCILIRRKSVLISLLHVLRAMPLFVKIGWLRSISN